MSAASAGRAGRLQFERDGLDWPNREASRFVQANGIRWHFQRSGAGPRLLLLHGTGASTHSWRSVLPLLAQRFDVVAPDLPGHAFTDPLPLHRMSLTRMTRALTAFLGAIDFAPDVVIGHSAGAAILARMALDRQIDPRLIVSLNGAFKPFEGLAGIIYPTVAKLLFANPFAAFLFASRASTATVTALMEGTGSHIDRRGLELYRRLFSNTDHVWSVLAMMSNWNIAGLAQQMVRLRSEMVFIVAEDDRAVPPDVSVQVAKRMKNAIVEHVARAGHLMHEERPDLVAQMIISHATKQPTPDRSAGSCSSRNVQPC